MCSQSPVDLAKQIVFDSKPFREGIRLLRSNETVLRLPIAERELRTGARSDRTYSSRRNIAAAAMLIFTCLYWNFGIMGGWPAGKIFSLLAGCCFLYTLFAGLILAADCISAEKRDGTLGLLFLTALKPHDLIAGMISANSLKAFCGLLAAFPVLGVTFLLGGVEYAEFARVCLTLVSALLFSLSLSLLVSCLSKKRLLAASRAALGLIFFSMAIPFVFNAVRLASPALPPRWLQVVNLFSPLTTLELAASHLMAARSDFWLSLFILNAMSAVMLLSSCLLLPWIWKDDAGASLKRLANRLRPRAKAEKVRPLRRGVRGQNPFFWLAIRQSFESTKFLIGLLLFGITAAVIGHFNITGGKNPAFESQVAAWSFLLATAHAALLFKFAALSTGRLTEDRELGALESILVTPLRVSTIIWGHWRALGVQLGGPLLAVLFLHGLIFWAFLTQYALDKEVIGGASAVLRLALDELRHGVTEPWELLCISAIIIGSAIIFCLNWIALGWSGMWISLRTRHASWAVWTALGVVLVPPIAAFALIVTIGVWLGLARGNGSYWAWYCILFGFAFGVLNAIGLIGYSVFRLRRDFRVVATQRFTRPAQRDWKSSIRWVIRITAASAAVVLAIFVFYGEEKWRGWRAWRKLERAHALRAEKLTTRVEPPPAVPELENFGAAKIFKPLFDYHYDSFGKVVWAKKNARADLMSITVTAGEQSYPWSKSVPDPRGNWRLQKPSDFPAWQSFYRTNAVFSSLSSTGAPAQAVLRALTVFSPELDELEESSRLPYCQFPIHYNETHAAFWLHLPFLKNVAGVLELRAAAKLAAGDIASSHSDIQFCLRLADAMKQTPGIYPFRIRMLILTQTLQPIWEGLAREEWSDDSLRILQQELSIDLLAEYPKAIREQTVSMADFFERVTNSDEDLLLRIGSYPIDARAAKFYPSGWRYLNQAGLFGLAENTLLPVVDSGSHRIFLSKAANLSAAIRRAHVRMDPISSRVIPWEVDSLGEVMLLTAHTQVSLDQALIACALKRWRLVHVTLPRSLESLAPQFIKSLPCDPITGSPYKYKALSGNRFLLWSLGWNGTDDGGKAVAEPPLGLEQDLRQGDWVWMYPEKM